MSNGTGNADQVAKMHFLDHVSTYFYIERAKERDKVSKVSDFARPGSRYPDH